MLDHGVRTEAEGDFVDFRLTGSAAEGQFHCADCGYGVSVKATLPACPMCGGRAWEESPVSASWRRIRPL